MHQQLSRRETINNTTTIDNNTNTNNNVKIETSSNGCLSSHQSAKNENEINSEKDKNVDEHKIDLNEKTKKKKVDKEHENENENENEKETTEWGLDVLVGDIRVPSTSRSPPPAPRPPPPTQAQLAQLSQTQEIGSQSNEIDAEMSPGGVDMLENDFTNENLNNRQTRASDSNQYESLRHESIEKSKNKNDRKSTNNVGKNEKLKSISQTATPLMNLNEFGVLRLEPTLANNKNNKKIESEIARKIMMSNNSGKNVNITPLTPITGQQSLKSKSKSTIIAKNDKETGDRHESTITNINGITEIPSQKFISRMF